jgi:hypothetical protein
MSNLNAAYQEPEALLDKMVGVSLSVQYVEVGGIRKLCLVATAMGKSCAVDIEAVDILDQVLNGKASGIFGGRTGTRLAAKYTSGLTITVADDAGFSDLDPIAVSNDDEAWEYGQVDGTPAANVITMLHALPSTHYKNAYVVNLAGLAAASGRAFNWRDGVVSQWEAPSSPAFTVADAAGDAIDVTITDPDEDAATHFDVFVYKQAAQPSRVDPNRQPDSADNTTTDITSDINVTTYGGGPDFIPDGAGGNLSSTDVIWVAVIAKDGTGQIGRKRSEALWVSHTLD